MNVSRSTYTRIYAQARQKVAQAFVEGRQIIIEGGKVYFDSDWYHCQTCSCYFNNPEKEIAVESCPLCGSERMKEYDYDNTKGSDTTKKCNDFCICPNCGYAEEHVYGNPCSGHVCPKCSTLMKRKRSTNCKN